MTNLSSTKAVSQFLHIYTERRLFERLLSGMSNIRTSFVLLLTTCTIVTSVQEESDPVDDETDEDKKNNNESSKGLSNADTFSALQTAMKWYEQQSECCPTQVLMLKRIRDLAAKKRRCTVVRRKIMSSFIYSMDHTFGYPNNRVSERCPVPIDSDKRRSTTSVMFQNCGSHKKTPNTYLYNVILIYNELNKKLLLSKKSF
ncbi:UNVERIFIED_CONTAM: hypothetical protein NCL1_12189 [Trichonephila clavipes]